MPNFPGRFSHDVTGKPIEAANVTIVPTIHASGWNLGAESAAGGATGWTVHVGPGPVTVNGADGQTSTLRLHSTTRPTLRVLATIGLGVAVVCGLIIVAVKRQ